MKGLIVDLVKLAKLDNLIRKAATGCHEDLAKQLGMSSNGLFKLISFLKDEMGAPIVYNENRPSYMYSYTPKFNLNFERERINVAEMNYTYVSSNDGDKKKNRIKVEVEIDDNEFILEDNIDFNDLYNSY